MIRVERTKAVYKKQDDESFEEINIDAIPFETIKNIVTPKSDDPLLYDGYSLNKNQIQTWNTFLNKKIEYDLELNSYILLCTGLYDW